jgi:hypothetical protein
MAEILQFPTSRTMDSRLAWQREKANPRLGWKRLADQRALLIIKEPGAGPPCPTCKRPMELRRHRQITDDQLCQDSYYSQWYVCAPYGECRTQTVMPPEFRVRNPPWKPRYLTTTKNEHGGGDAA